MNTPEEISPRKILWMTLPEFIASIPAVIFLFGVFTGDFRPVIVSIVVSLLLLGLSFTALKALRAFESAHQNVFYFSILIAAGLVCWGDVAKIGPLFYLGALAAVGIAALAYFIPKGNPVALQIYGKNFELPWLVPIFHSAVALLIALGCLLILFEPFRLGTDGKIPLACAWLALFLGLIGVILLLVATFYPRSSPWISIGIGPSYKMVKPYIIGCAALVLLFIAGLGSITLYVQLHPVAPQLNQPQGAGAAITRIELTTPFS
jgi:hypothetical protein